MPVPDPRAADQLRRRQPMFNLPRATQMLVGINVLVHLVRVFLLPEHLDWELIATAAVIPARYSYGPGFDLPSLIAPLTFQFLHGGFLHLLLNMALLAAWGRGGAHGRSLAHGGVLSGHRHAGGAGPCADLP
ncbi:hypothetical protein ACFQ4K_21495 [Tistrella bauzanensis]